MVCFIKNDSSVIVALSWIEAVFVFVGVHLKLKSSNFYSILNLMKDLQVCSG